MIRELFDQGISNKDIIDILNLDIQINEVRRIGCGERFQSI